MAKTPSTKTPRGSLVVDPEREHQVRERAYYLWEAEGKPHGRDVEYWERARELVAVEEGAARHPPPPGSARQPASRTAEAAKTSHAETGRAEARTPERDEVKPAAAAKRKARAKPKKS